MKGTSVCAAGAAALVSSSNRFRLGVLRHVCIFLCVYASLDESVVADRIGMAAWWLSSGIATCVDTCRFATWCCKTHCNGCMNVAWDLFWGGSWSTKPGVFPCKVTAADDEWQLVCAAGAAGVVLTFFLCRSVAVASSSFGCVCVCVRSFRVFWNLWSSGVAMCVDTACRFATWCCETHCNGCMSVAWGLFWGGCRSTKPCAFPCKMAAGGDEEQLVREAVASALVLTCFFCRTVTVASSCFGCGCVCVRSSMRLWNLWLQIALECLHLIVVIWYCHVRRYMQVCDVMLQNAL